MTWLLSEVLDPPSFAGRPERIAAMASSTMQWALASRNAVEAVREAENATLNRHLDWLEHAPMSPQLVDRIRDDSRSAGQALLSLVADPGMA